MNTTPRYEKVDSHTIKIIQEKATDVPISTLLANKEKIESELKRMKEVLKNINEMLGVAKELGITAKIKSKDVEKKVCPLCKGTDIPCPQCEKHLKEKK